MRKSQPKLTVNRLSARGSTKVTIPVSGSASKCKNNHLRTMTVEIPENQAEHDNEEEPPKKETKYYQACKKVLAAWQDLRSAIDTIRIEAASPASFTCCVCKEEVVNNSIVHCSDCGPATYFCTGCIELSHRCNPFHQPRIWKGSAYVPYKFENVPTVEFFHERTNSCRECRRTLVVVTAKAQQIVVAFEFCTCEKEALTLLRNSMWPSSPTQPGVAYHLDFLAFAEALMLECHVSLVGFCEAISVLLKWHEGQARHLYGVLVSECWEEFRNSQHRFRLFTDTSSQCPACPKEGAIVSMDANFGLVRKKTSGVSLEQPKHNDTFFLTDEAVDTLLSVNASTTASTDSQDCSNFQAGTKLRSRGKAAKYDIQGVFGAVCRHELPLKFLNLKQGEKLCYPYILLKELKGNKERLLVTYDIACMFEKFLQGTDSGRALRRGLVLAVPQFHVYGHQASCQVLYSPRRLPGYGMTDGEGIERLWSYLRGFSKMTKEMTPSHRTDLLSDALFYFRRKKIYNLSKYLLKRSQDAEKQASSLAKELAVYEKDLNAPLTPQVLGEWQQDERHAFSKSSTDRVAWQERYVGFIDMTMDLHKKVSLTDQPEQLAVLQGELADIEEKLQSLEKRHGIKERWTLASQQYKTASSSALLKKKTALLRKMQHHAREWRHSLNIKDSYAVGQAIAIRVNRRIGKEAEQLNRLLKAYNACGFSSIPLTFSDISDAKGPVYSLLSSQVSRSSTPVLIRQEILQKHARLKRCEEEVEMSSMDAFRLCEFVCHQREELAATFHALSGNATISRRYREGQQHLLYSKCLVLEEEYEVLCTLFPSVKFPPLECSFTSANDFSKGDSGPGLDELSLEALQIVMDSIPDALSSDSETDD